VRGRLTADGHLVGPDADAQLFGPDGVLAVYRVLTMRSLTGSSACVFEWRNQYAMAAGDLLVATPFK